MRDFNSDVILIGYDIDNMFYMEDFMSYEIKLLDLPEQPY